jgi:hypothetical protein
VIASLFGSTAYALVAGSRTPAPHSEPAPAIAPAIDEPAVAMAPPRVRVERQLTMDRPALPPPVRPEPPPRVDESIARQPEVAIPTPRSRELALYRVAHEAHFRGTDPHAALAAWDAYLAELPHSQRAPEARWNRALVLIKLGRHAEAKTALAPFANAPAGSYRQREAAQLLEALP